MRKNIEIRKYVMEKLSITKREDRTRHIDAEKVITSEREIMLHNQKF